MGRAKDVVRTSRPVLLWHMLLITAAFAVFDLFPELVPAFLIWIVGIIRHMVLKCGRMTRACVLGAKTAGRRRGQS